MLLFQPSAYPRGGRGRVFTLFLVHNLFTVCSYFFSVSFPSIVSAIIKRAAVAVGAAVAVAVFALASRGRIVAGRREHRRRETVAFFARGRLWSAVKRSAYLYRLLV